MDEALTSIMEDAHQLSTKLSGAPAEVADQLEEIRREMSGLLGAAYADWKE